MLQIQQDTLVIWGDKDKILPKEYAEVDSSLKDPAFLRISVIIDCKNGGYGILQDCSEYPFTKICFFMQRFQKEIPRAQLQYVQDSGHLPHVEKPPSVADLILKFINPEY